MLSYLVSRQASIIDYHLCFILKTDDPFELDELPESPVLADGVLFDAFGVLGNCGKYPSIPIVELGGVLALEEFIRASGL